jgi:hypothetical protein
MVTRKGLGKNRGMGYKNLIPKYDSNRHSLNARGYKMAQRMPMMQCGGKDQFSKLRGKQVIIKAKRWFDKVNGNTYHSVVVYVDSKIIGENPFAYGYDEAYLQTAHKILQSKGYLPDTKERLSSGMDADYYNWQMFNREHRDKLLTFVDDVGRKKDLGGKGGKAEDVIKQLAKESPIEQKKFEVMAIFGDDHNLKIRNLDAKVDINPQEAPQLIKLVKNYNEFNGEKVAKAVQKVKNDLMNVKFGREGSCVLYLELPYWTNQKSGFKSGENRRLSDAEIAAIKNKIKATFAKTKYNEYDYEGLTDNTLRIWWD